MYCYIKDYFTDHKVFGIEAALLDLENPQHVIARITEPLLTPGKKYELYGHVPDIVFPSGGLVNGEKLFVYYGAADTSTALATCDLKDILAEFHPEEKNSEAEE